MLLLLLLLVSPAASYRVLLVLPMPTRSHHAGGARLAHALTSKGHQVVEVSPYRPKGNWSWVPIEVKSLADAVPNFADEIVQAQSFVNGRKVLWRICNAYTRHIINLPALRRFILHDNSHFDLVIAEAFAQSVFYLFAHKYKAPLIILTAFGSAHYISNFMGNSLELAYVPHEFIDYFGPMNFFQRIRNLGCTIYDLVSRKWYSTYAQDELAREVFGHLGVLPSVEELERNVSLALLNAHCSLSAMRPGLPNIVDVGGLHIEEPKPLSEEFRRILDAATSGAVLFSFGSMLDLSAQPPALAEATLRALARLSHPVLLKWGSTSPLPFNASNLHPFAWLPQNDILAHTNLAVFITHGGLLSGQEAVYHAVPTVCIPFFGDHPLNCQRTIALGLGVHVEPQDLTADVLYGAIQKVLTNSSYKNNAQELSLRFRDRPNSAIDTAIYWIEYCARHKGMDFAKSPKRNLYWWQYLYVDFALFIWMMYRFVVFLKNIGIEMLRRKIKRD